MQQISGIGKSLVENAAIPKMRSTRDAFYKFAEYLQNTNFEEHSQLSASKNVFC